jgi:Putative Flp pilus-assembly TadE/G-like
MSVPNLKEPAMRNPGTDAGGTSGQALVVMLGVVLVALALLAFIVDGGNVLAQQRIAQNGADASAEAGAVLLAERLAGSSQPSGGWDATISDKLTQTAAANNMTIDAAYYTDICGIPLQADGTAALNLDHTEDLAAALQVGNATNSLPGGTSTAPDCPNRLVGPVAGVLVVAHKSVPALVARAINIQSFSVTTRATAVAGYLQSYCDSSEGHFCALLPVAFPVDIIKCDGNNKPADTGTPWTFNVVYKIPLCQSNPGNVGWLDWTPTAGGTGELVCSILTPDNPSIDLPSWQYVTATGNTNGGGGACGMSIEDALRTYEGQTVLVPQFDLTCNPSHNGTPNSSEPPVITPSDYGCPSGDLGGSGSNQWYRMPSFAFLEMCGPSVAGCGGLHDAYISGSNSAICDTGNGATSCLVAKYVNVMATGTVGAGVGSGTGNKALGVQLIK